MDRRTYLAGALAAGSVTSIGGRPGASAAGRPTTTTLAYGAGEYGEGGYGCPTRREQGQGRR